MKSLNQCLVRFVALLPTGLFALIGFSGSASADCSKITPATMSPGSLTFIAGAPDRVYLGAIIGGWSSAVYSGIDSDVCTTTAGWSSWAEAIKAPTALSVTNAGITYPVYATEYPGLGYIVQAYDTSSQALVQQPTSSVYATTGNGHVYLGVRTTIVFVVSGQLKPGVYNLAPAIVGTAYLSNNRTTNTRIASVPIRYNGLTITVTGSTCTVNPADANQTVRLPTVALQEFAGIGSNAGSASFTMGLACTGTIALRATMTDVTAPSNRTNVLTLAPSSTASGIGVQIFANGSAMPVSYGADSSTAGNINQWTVGSGTYFTIPFTAKYVKTAATVKPGSVSAVSTITFSYQ